MEMIIGSERENKYRSSAYDIGWGRTRSCCSQWILWSFAFAVGQSY